MFYSTFSPTTSQYKPSLLWPIFPRQATHGLSRPPYPQILPESTSHFLTTKFDPSHVFLLQNLIIIPALLPVSWNLQ